MIDGVGWMAGGRGNREKERLRYWKNVRDNKQEGKQRSKSKEAKLVRRIRVRSILSVALVRLWQIQMWHNEAHAVSPRTFLPGDGWPRGSRGLAMQND